MAQLTFLVLQKSHAVRPLALFCFTSVVIVFPREGGIRIG
jgi:hypothetical protein